MELIVGTRGSKLAIAQTNEVVNRLKEIFPNLELQTITIKTVADKFESIPLHKIEGKGVFIKEIDEALLDGKIDFAVHSMKDVPTELAEGIVIVATPHRKTPNDVLFLRNSETLDKLAEGSVIGTGSFRRAALLKRVRPDIVISPIRGNVDTRIRKVQEGEYDGVVLAEAGLERLGLKSFVTQRLPLSDFLPSGGQGVLAVTARKNDSKVLRILREVNDESTFAEALAERSFIRAIGGGCRVPVGVVASSKIKTLTLEAEILSIDGKSSLRKKISGDSGKAGILGEKLAQQLLQSGGRTLIDNVVKEIGRITSKDA